MDITIKPTDYIFTDSRICSVAQLLWNFDDYKAEGINKGMQYYEFRLSNTDLSLVLFKKDIENYSEQDKYSLLMLLYIINKIPKLFQDKQLSFNITKKEILSKFNLNTRNISVEDYIGGLYKLKFLNITYDYVAKDGTKMRKISSIINSIDYSKEHPDKYCTIELSKWVFDLLVNIEYLNSKFYEGSINYTPFIQGKNPKTECMNLPQKFVELYRINCNKREKVVYKNIDYFQEIFNTDKVLRRKFIERIIKNINISLATSNLKLEFNCDFTPNKFKDGSFIITSILK